MKFLLSGAKNVSFEINALPRFNSIFYLNNKKGIYQRNDALCFQTLHITRAMLHQVSYHASLLYYMVDKPMLFVCKSCTILKCFEVITVLCKDLCNNTSLLFYNLSL